jgi:hypothetical protein
MTEHETDKMTEHITDKMTEHEADIITELETEKLTDKITNKIENHESSNTIEENTEINKASDNNGYTEIIQKFSPIDFFKESQKINNENPGKKDEIIQNIKEDLMNGNLDILLQGVTDGEKKDLIAQDNDLIYQITTTENQQNNTYNNISTINLGDCEQKLKDTYHINYSLPLIILKVDYYKPGLLIPVIGYEVYDPINKTQLKLDCCKDSLVKLNIPVSINEDNLFKYDPESDYYNDKCNSYTTENGTDILINDRQNEFNDNNLSLCENNCTFKGYDKYTKKALCECETKPKIGLISEIIKANDLLSNNFNTTDDTSSNIDAMKCIDALFSKEGLLSNIGSYLFLFSLVFFAVSSTIFYKCGFYMIEKILVI